jgi:hypothetical membrane protein
MLSRRLLLGLLPIASLTWLTASVLIAGALRPGYSHSAQFMSELGAPGAWTMNVFGFIPTELLMLAFVALAAKALRRSPLALVGLALLAVYAIGLIIGALAPCDLGCRPAVPSLTHQMHMLAGLIAYLSALISITVLAIAAARRGAWRLMVAGFVCAAGGIGLLVILDPDLAQVGLVQRGLEALIYGWLILFGVWLSRLSDEAPPAPG